MRLYSSLASASLVFRCYASFSYNNDKSGVGAGLEPPCSAELDNWGNRKEDCRPITTLRASIDDFDDVSDDFLDALTKSNNGGLLHLEKGKKYVLGKKLDLSFLNDVYVKLEGEIKFTDNIEYWQSNNFAHPFQRSITFWKWGGKDIKIFGGGVVNGNGQKWYDGFAGREILDASNTYLRPILFFADNATNLEVTDVEFLNSPCWITFLVNTKNAVFDRVRMIARSTNQNKPKNTDGFDTLNVDGLTIIDNWIDVGDDCYSAKPNTTNFHIENLFCNNTHGVSMGSIGQYPGTMDYISNGYIKNVTLLNGQNGVRIKSWAGKDKGYGYVRNITYQDIIVENTDYPVLLDQCYFNIKADECKQFPSKVNITDVNFINIKGSSSGKRGPKVVEIMCSPGAECKNIFLKDINIRSPKSEEPDGSGTIVCKNVEGEIGLPCVSS